MRVFVPFDARDPKTRLAPLLDEGERRGLARAMLGDVLDALAATAQDPCVLATDDVDCDCPVRVDEQALTPAVNDALDSIDEPAAVVMADLALVTPATLMRLFASDAGVVLAPGRGGGTNALVTRTPDFRVDYHGLSYRDHLVAAREAGVNVATVDSFRLATDVDEPADLVDVLVHTTGRTADCLRERGLSLTVTDDGPAVTRSS
jgi:2-phospho-L-lactate guanylyltransferase